MKEERKGEKKREENVEQEEQERDEDNLTYLFLLDSKISKGYYSEVTYSNSFCA